MRVMWRALPKMLIVAASLLGMPAYGVELPDRIVLAGVQGSADGWAADVILREAYRRIGIELVIRKVPGARALRLTTVGKLDGEVQRIDAFKNAHPTLMQVGPAINFLEAMAFSGMGDIEIEGWQSLQPYKVGVVRGIKFAIDNTTGMRRYMARDYESVFRMLMAKRLDVAIAPRINGLLHQAQMQLVHIRELQPPLMRLDMFHYLHTKHAAWAPILAAELSKMQSEGRLAVIRKHVHSVLLILARNHLEICTKNYRCFEQGLQVP